MVNKEILRADKENHQGTASPSLSPRVEDSEATTNVQQEEDLMQSKVEEIPRSSPQVDSPLSQDPDFIKAGFHLGKYITTVMNTEVEQVDI
jgi:hypothetical protein